MVLQKAKWENEHTETNTMLKQKESIKSHLLMYSGVKWKQVNRKRELPGFYTLICPLYQVLQVPETTIIIRLLLLKNKKKHVMV